MSSRVVQVHVEAIKSTLLDIGYLDENLVDDYVFTSFTRDKSEDTHIACAAFQRQPHTTVTACVGIIDNATEEEIRKYEFLSAPQIINLKDNFFDVYSLRSSGNYKKRSFDTIEEIRQYISSDDSWSPESIIRAKNIGVQDYDNRKDIFDLGVPLSIDAIIEKKIQDLIVRSLQKLGKIEDHLYRPIIHSLFELIIAKYLLDSSDLDKEKFVNASEALVLLPEARQKFFKLLPISLIQTLWSEIYDSFSLKNVSPQHLVHVYEGTLVDRQTRRELGIHATPHRLANIIVNSLPIEKLDPQERRVFEPFCGHAPFLVAAANKLTLLGEMEGLTPLNAKVQAYENLSGIEIDSFAIEVGRYALQLSSYPLDISLRLHNEDVFKYDSFDKIAEASDIVICNPPYESAIENSSTLGSKANIAVQKIIKHSPKILALILPKSFGYGKNNRSVLENIAKSYNSIHLISLPEDIFSYSEIETIAILAWNDSQVDGIKIVRQSVYKKDYEKFLSTGQPSRETIKYYTQDNVFPFWEESLTSELAGFTNHLRRIRDVAKGKKGIQWRIGLSPTEYPQSDAGLGIYNLDQGWEKYILPELEQLAISPDSLLFKTDLTDWQKPKVIVNASRRSRNLVAWRLDAAVDEQGVYASQRFFGIWPHLNNQIWLLAAVLNSPISNIIIYGKSGGRDNTLRDVMSLPFPDISTENSDKIANLIQEYITLNRNRSSGRWGNYVFERSKEILSIVDATIMASYQLSNDLYLKSLIFYLTNYTETYPLPDMSEIRDRVLSKYFAGTLASEDLRVANFAEWISSSEYEYLSLKEAIDQYGQME